MSIIYTVLKHDFDIYSKGDSFRMSIIYTVLKHKGVTNYLSTAFRMSIIYTVLKPQIFEPCISSVPESLIPKIL